MATSRTQRTQIVHETSLAPLIGGFSCTANLDRLIALVDRLLDIPEMPDRRPEPNVVRNSYSAVLITPVETDKHTIHLVRTSSGSREPRD